jgi:hypothetical protein
MSLDALHNQQVKLDDDVFAFTVRETKVDESKILKASVRFYQFDDGWHPSSKSGEDLKGALVKSEK